MPKLPKLSHFNYDELDVHCTCDLCEAERFAGNKFTSFMSTREQHSWTCQCDSCKTRGEIYEGLLLASVKRDTYSELSYLVQSHPDRGPFLAWVWRATQKEDNAIKTFNRSWWIGQGVTVTLGWWLKKWKMLSGVDLFEKPLQKDK